VAVDKFWMQVTNCFFYSGLDDLMVCKYVICHYMYMQKELLQSFVCRSSFDFE